MNTIWSIIANVIQLMSELKEDLSDDKCYSVMLCYVKASVFMILQQQICN